MPLNFNPPLLNSANPWATTREDLKALYDCPHTGAITTRTSILDGFKHDDAVHQYCFFQGRTQQIKTKSSNNDQVKLHRPSTEPISSLNTLGYSPMPISDYTEITRDILLARRELPLKPVIFSVTGTRREVADQWFLISNLVDELQKKHNISARVFIEVNLSCPNIFGKPPPAYSKSALLDYFEGFVGLLKESGYPQFGIKTPPYTYQTQFDDLISALLEAFEIKNMCPIAFITATNTLGNCLVLDPTTTTPALNSSNGTGIGGLAGSALHPLALGNVATLRRMLDAHDELKRIEIIGVGGVSDAAGYERMRSVGASAVAVGTALGAEGVGVFERIWKSVEEKKAD